MLFLFDKRSPSKRPRVEEFASISNDDTEEDVSPSTSSPETVTSVPGTSTSHAALVDPPDPKPELSIKVYKKKGYVKNKKWGFDVYVTVGGIQKSKQVKTEHEAMVLALAWKQEATKLKKIKRESSRPEMTMLRKRFQTELQSNDLTAALRTCLAQVELKNRVLVTASPDYPQLKKVCDAQGKRCCTSCSTVLDCIDFHIGKAAGGGFQSACKLCNANGQKTERKKRRLAGRITSGTIRAAMSHVQNLLTIEDEFANWMVPIMQKLGFTVVVMEEFRRADVLVRRPSWHNDAYVRLQLKADSGVQKGTNMPKPMRSQIQFGQTFGYGAIMTDSGVVETVTDQRMVMLCGGKRAETMEELEAMDYVVWCFDGESVNSPCLHVDKPTGTLLGGLRECDGSSKDRLLPVSMPQVAAFIDAAYHNATFPKTTYIDAMLDVQCKTQRKEIVLMLCLQQAFKYQNLVFPVGSQTAVDCVFDKLATQFKTYNVKSYYVRVAHRTKGQCDVPYDVSDGIEQFVGGFLLRCDGRYFFFHVRTTTDTLLANGRLEDRANQMFAVCLNFSPWMPDKYHKWIWGRTVPFKDDTKFTTFRTPIEIKPDSILTEALLHEVSHEAADPSAMAHALDTTVPEVCKTHVSMAAKNVRRLIRERAKLTGVPLPPRKLSTPPKVVTSRNCHTQKALTNTNLNHSMEQQQQPLDVWPIFTRAPLRWVDISPEWVSIVLPKLPKGFIIEFSPPTIYCSGMVSFKRVADEEGCTS